jgi:hypothetical protein
LAATRIGLFVLFAVIMFCVPIMVQHGSDIGSGLNVPVDTLLLSSWAENQTASSQTRDHKPTLNWLRSSTAGRVSQDRRESLYYSILNKSCYGRIWEIPEDAFWISPNNILAMRKDSKVDIAHTHFRRHSIVVTRGLQRQPHDEPNNPQNENRHGYSCVGILVALDFFERRN